MVVVNGGRHCLDYSSGSPIVMECSRKDSRELQLYSRGDAISTSKRRNSVRHHSVTESAPASGENAPRTPCRTLVWVSPQADRRKSMATSASRRVDPGICTPSPPQIRTRISHRKKKAVPKSLASKVPKGQQRVGPGTTTEAFGAFFPRLRLPAPSPQVAPKDLSPRPFADAAGAV